MRPKLNLNWRTIIGPPAAVGRLNASIAVGQIGELGSPFETRRPAPPT